ncbi:MAG: hypothetical protein CL932_15595 [Deltaproteobacteria bacterium]|nr:hypothetical protein [Deltaproteobacteria bacterium]
MFSVECCLLTLRSRLRKNDKYAKKAPLLIAKQKQRQNNVSNPHESTSPSSSQPWLLLLSVFLMVGNGIILELMIAGYSAHLYGDSIYQFSLTIGLFMSAMGVGSWLTQRVESQLIAWLCDVQIFTAFAAGITITALSLVGMYTASYPLFSLLWTALLGGLTGFQLPLVIRIIERDWSVKRLLAQVLFIDYVGALAGSLLLPWWLMPRFGFANSSIIVGALCLLSVCLLWIGFGATLRRSLWRNISILALGVSLLLGWQYSQELLDTLAQRRVPGVKQIYLKRSPYQEIRFTKYKGSYFLTLNRQSQFSTQDERRYHETLVHPAMLAARSRKRVLLLGGGDGLAMREIWRYHDVEEVVMVDLDPAMTDFGRTHPIMKTFNENSMVPHKTRTYCLYKRRCDGQQAQLIYEQLMPDKTSSCPSPKAIGIPKTQCRLDVRKVHTKQRLIIKNEDAWKYIEHNKQPFSVIISDLPDATNISLSKLYSVEFYRSLRKRLTADGAMSVQSTSVSPFFRRAYWCIVNTITEAGFRTHGYHTWVPSFGTHTSYTLATQRPIQPKTLILRTPTHYLNQHVVPNLFWFPKDISHVNTPVNKIDTHILLRFFLNG